MSRSIVAPAFVAAVWAAGARAQPRRLRIVNGCGSEPMWIAHIAAGAVGPDPQDVRIEPGQFYDFMTSDGLSATRYWPKMGCDAAGNNCLIGDSGGPGEGCVRRQPGRDDDYSHCAPPVDTKFEASFGVNGQPCNPAAPGGTQMAGCDFVDISLVDGFTLPVKLEVSGGACEDSRSGGRVEEIDCRDLTLDACPAHEDLMAAGMHVSLQAVSPTSGGVVGCYSPCLRLIDDKWQTQPRKFAEDPEARMYCCPTPPVSPDQCRQGPIVQTDFLKLVHSKCPGAYAYSYDDGMGLLRCESSSQYTLTYYCPAQRRLASANMTLGAGSSRLRGVANAP